MLYTPTRYTHGQSKPCACKVHNIGMATVMQAMMPTPTLRVAPDNTPRRACAAMRDITPRPQLYTTRASIHIQVVHMKTVKAICSSNSVPRKFVINLFVRESIMVVVIAMQCVSCFALPRTDPQLDRKFLRMFVCTRNDYSFTRAIKFSGWKESEAGHKPLLTYTNIQWTC